MTNNAFQLHEPNLFYKFTSYESNAFLKKTYCENDPKKITPRENAYSDC